MKNIKAYVAKHGFDGDLYAAVEVTDEDGFSDSVAIVGRTSGKSVGYVAKLAAKRLRKLADEIERQEKTK